MKIKPAAYYMLDKHFPVSYLPSQKYKQFKYNINLYFPSN